jgi:hypothetical protein
MTTAMNNSSFQDQEGASFLARDFDQCFAQLRHYDSQIWAVCRFALTAYVTIVGAAVGIYQYSLDRDINLVSLVISVLGVGIALGILIYGLIIRNRVYFVVVCRYINEHRALFLASQPLGFANSSGMYVDSSKPPYFNWRSWQSCLAYITALLNAALVGLLMVFVLDEHAWRWWLSGTLGLFSWLSQVGLGIAYLRSREKMAGSDAVFGEAEKE